MVSIHLLACEILVLALTLIYSEYSGAPSAMYNLPSKSSSLAVPIPSVTTKCDEMTSSLMETSSAKVVDSGLSPNTFETALAIGLSSINGYQVETALSSYFDPRHTSAVHS